MYKESNLEKKLNIITEWIIIIIFTITPLLRFSYSYDSFILPKIVWLKCLIWILAGIVLIKIFNQIQFRFFLSKINLWILIFFIIHIISLFKAKSISLGWERVGFWAIIIVFLSIFQDSVKRNTSLVAKLLFGIIVSGTLTSLWVVYQDFASVFFPEKLNLISKLEDWRGYLSAGFGNTSHIGDFIAIAWFIGFGRLIFSVKKSDTIFLLITSGLMFPGLIVCWSVTSNFSLMMGIMIFFFFLMRNKVEKMRLKRRIIVIITLLIICLLISLFYIIDNPLNPHAPGIFKQAFSSERWKAGGPTRLAIWYTTIEMIKQNAILGVGAGNFTYIYPQILSYKVLSDPQLIKYAGSYTNAAHNDFLQIFSETGLIGLISFLVILGIFFKFVLLKIFRNFPPRDRFYYALFALTAMMIIQSLMNFILQLPYSTLLFFSMISLPFVFSEKLDGSKILVPVEFDISIMKTTVYLENMEYPAELGISLNGSRFFKFLTSVGIVLLVTLAILVSLKSLSSDVWYKRASVYKKLNNIQSAEFCFKKSLLLNPEHSDCRSSYSDFLVQQGRFEEAVKEIKIVHKRLKSNEIYMRLAIAYEGLGKKEKSLESWKLFFQTYPLNKEYYAEQYKKLFEQNQIP